MTKTNVMRLLDAAGIHYEPLSYPVEESDLSGEHAAGALGLPLERVFKTLVLRGDRNGLFACCIPCHEEIDLRKAAQASGDKKCEMLPMRELLGATGYMRGGCSPIGMKHKLPLFVEEAALLFDLVAISAGMRGVMVLISPEDLIRYTGAAERDLIRAV